LNWVSTVVVGNGVPNGVEVRSTANAGKVLLVTTGITRGVGWVNFRDGVKGLMNITNVVDDQAESERSGISLDWEVLDDLLVVVAGLVVSTTVWEPLGQVSEGWNNFVHVGLEGEVRERTTLIKVGLVNEVPSRLEAVSAFDVIGKSCSLSEGVFILASGQRSMGGLECAQFSESSSEDIGVGLFKDDLGFSGNYKRRNKKKV